MAWHVIFPGKKFVDNWSVKEICKHLQLVSEGTIKRLIVNIPPGGMKSLLVSVFWPAWCWIDDPAYSTMPVSYDGTLTMRDARKMLEIVQSKWFQERWGGKFTLPAAAAASDFINSCGGFRFSTSIGGKITGRHPNAIIIDDPIKAQEVTRVALDQVIETWRSGLSTRGEAADVAYVIIMQRLHEDDLVGYVLREEAFDDWTVLRFPMRYEASNPCITPWGGDPRTEEGELFWPARFPSADVAKREFRLRAGGTAAQHQQRPSPEGGYIFQRSWFQFWKTLPGRFDLILGSVDAAFKDTSKSDFVVIQVWGKRGGEFYLLDMVRGQWDFVETCAQLVAMKEKWKLRKILIEDKANGPAIISTMKGKVSGLVAIEPQGSKEARASACTGEFEAKNVWLPPIADLPVVGIMIEELANFPTAKHDDCVDTTSQAINHMVTQVSGYAAALKKLNEQRKAHEGG